jgi:Uma2 family endonuclease
MTAIPLQPPRLLTVAEFAALDEAHDGRYELQEGKVVMSPSPPPEHQLYQQELQVQLLAQVPVHLKVVPATGIRRRREEGGLLRANEVVLAIEILSVGSQRTDRLIKHAEYADAGIPHYWLIDIDSRPALTACHLAGEFGYVDAAPVNGTFTADEPFPLRLDLDRLG